MGPAITHPPKNAVVSSYGIISTMVRPTRVSIILLMAALAAGLAWLKAQQSDPAYSSQPGGTPEGKLWQALILFGAGDSEPAAWNGHLTADGGEIHAVEGYRFELPDRLLPQGGWEARTQMTRILKSSPVEGNSSGDETRVIPKGLLVRGAGPAVFPFPRRAARFRFHLQAWLSAKLKGSCRAAWKSAAFHRLRIYRARRFASTTFLPSQPTPAQCGPPGRASMTNRKS